MAIEIIEGDLLEAFDRGDVQVIAHVVNCQGVMGSGIAKSIRQRYGNVYEHYKCTLGDFESFDEDPLGHAQAVPVDYTYTNIVVNLYAQRFYGEGQRHLNYGALAQGLHWLCRRFDKGLSIGFPYKMGSDRAGGDWEIVLEMIEFYFKDHEVKIYRLPK